MSYTLRQIQETHINYKISTGDQNLHPLKLFLQKDALPFHQSNIAKTYILTNESFINHICGYITLMNSEISFDSCETQKPNNPPSAMKYQSFPAIKIARLLIDKDHRKNGLGKMLLDWAINHIRLLIMPNVGCRFIAVDAKKDSIGFYEKNGFIIMNSPKNLSDPHPLMFLDLNNI